MTDRQTEKEGRGGGGVKTISSRKITVGEVLFIIPPCKQVYTYTVSKWRLFGFRVTDPAW